MAAKKLIKKPVKRVRRFQEGGETADKAAGLEISNRDKPMGFFERLRMGNIDQEGSEAYNRLGAGRAKADRDAASERASSRVVDDMRGNQANQNYNESTLQDDDEMGAAMRRRMQESDGELLERANAEGVGLQPNFKRKPSAAVTNSSSIASGPATKAKVKSDPYQDRVAPAPRSNYSNEGRGQEMTKAQQYARAEAEAKTPEGVAKRKKQETDQGLERVTPETYLIGGGGLKMLAEFAKKLAAPRLAKYSQEALPAPTKQLTKYSQEALPAPTKQLTYDKAGAFASKRSERASARQDEMLKENARRYGLDEAAPGYKAAADAVRKELGGKDFGLKKGGAVKRSAPMKKMSSGGVAKSSTSMASKRADGIAQRGKTRGKVC